MTYQLEVLLLLFLTLGLQSISSNKCYIYVLGIPFYPITSLSCSMYQHKPQKLIKICFIKTFIFSTSTVDCQLSPWTSCDSDCGFAGKMRFFGRRPEVERKRDKCSQGDTWQICGNLPPCAGDYIYLYHFSGSPKNN